MIDLNSKMGVMIMITNQICVGCWLHHGILKKKYFCCKARTTTVQYEVYGTHIMVLDA